MKFIAFLQKLRLPAGLLLLIVALLPFGAIHSLADQPMTVYLYEDSTPVDETAYCSYSESHLIWLPTQTVIGYPSGDLVPVTDANNNITGYEQMLVDADDDSIGYLLYPADPPIGGGPG